MANLSNEGNNAQVRTFEQEFFPLLDAVVAFSYRLTGDKTQAEDLAQETFLKAWRFMERYTAGTNAKAWLFRICRNAFINDWRTRKTQPQTRDLDDLGLRQLPLATSPSDDRMGDEVTRAMNALSEPFRAVILLDLEDFTYQEMSVILSIKIGTVRSRLHRARKELAKNLQVYGRAQGYNVHDNEGAVGEDDDTQDDS